MIRKQSNFERNSSKASRYLVRSSQAELVEALFPRLGPFDGLVRLSLPAADRLVEARVTSLSFEELLILRLNDFKEDNNC
jgi:hypothetical protein